MHHSKRELIQTDFPHVPAIRSSRPNCQPGEIPAGSQTGNGVPRIPGELSIPNLGLLAKKMRKIQQNAQALLHQRPLSVRDLATFVGKVTATVRAIW